MNSAARLVSCSLRRASAAGWKFQANGWRHGHLATREASGCLTAGFGADRPFAAHPRLEREHSQPPKSARPLLALLPRGLPQADRAVLGAFLTSARLRESAFENANLRTPRFLLHERRVTVTHSPSRSRRRHGEI